MIDLDKNLHLELDNLNAILNLFMTNLMFNLFDLIFDIYFVITLNFLRFKIYYL
jgi:hypothetical protein